MNNSPRQQGSQTASPYQAVLKAFLAEYHMSGLLYHCLLARHLALTGFEVRHVERKGYQDVWVLKLGRGQVPAGHELDWTQKQVGLFLRRHGLRYPRKEIVVMVQGNRIEAAFKWSRGEAGWVSYDPQKAGRTGQSKG